MNDQSLTDRALPEHLPDWGVTVLESHHSPNFTMDWREHRFFKLLYVLHGRGVLEFRDRIDRFEQGDVLVVPPGCENRIVDAPDAASSLYVCCIASTVYAMATDSVQQLQPGLISASPHFANRIATQLRRMRHQQVKPDPWQAVAMVASALRVMKWLLQLRSDLDGRHSHGKQRPYLDDRQLVQEYVERLSTEFYEATTIEQAAKSIGVSRRVFTDRFQEFTGTTWLTYVRRLAINHAKHQLVQTDLPIASIAFECGFNDLSTFYRQFKSQVKLSPKRYRAENQL